MFIKITEDDINKAIKRMAKRKAISIDMITDTILTEEIQNEIEINGRRPIDMMSKKNKLYRDDITQS